MAGLLTKTEINKRLRALKGWNREGRFITKHLEFGDFGEAIRFINKVAEIAERQEHHPDMQIRYNEVTLSVQTHSKGGVTEWDFDLARKIDRILP